MLQIVCDNCGKVLTENNQTLKDWREIRIEISRCEVKEAHIYHLCNDHCVDRFKELLSRFMSE